MALSPNINNREFDKFKEVSGETSVNVNIVGGASGTTLKEQIFNASDLEETYTWADFGTNKERVTLIVYEAPSVSVTTLHKTFTYTLTGGKYRLDSVQWSEV